MLCKIIEADTILISVLTGRKNLRFQQNSRDFEFWGVNKFRRGQRLQKGTIAHVYTDVPTMLWNQEKTY